MARPAEEACREPTVSDETVISTNHYLLVTRR